MKVLITGGTGTISSGLVREAVNRGYETWAITRGKNISRNIAGAQYLTADVYDDTEIQAILGKQTFDVIVECLAYTVKQLKISLSNFADRCSQYVFISTAGVYDRTEKKVRLTEDAPKNQTRWNYSRNKLECENYLKEYFANRDNHYTIIRPTVTYGNYRIPYPIATRTPTWTLFERMKQGAPLLACKDIKQSVIHINDFSNAVTSLFGNPQAYQGDFHISCNGYEIYWDDVVHICAEILQVPSQIIHVPVELLKWTFPSVYMELKWNKTTDLLVDDAKLKKAVPDFQPAISYRTGLGMLISIENVYFDSSAAQLDMNWWDDCDLTILCAYRLNKLNAEEKKIAKTYISTWSKDKRRKLRHLLVTHCTKNQLGQILRNGWDWR